MTESQYRAHVVQLNAIIEDLQQKLLDRDFELQTCADSARHDVVHSTPQSSGRQPVCVRKPLLNSAHTQFGCRDRIIYVSVQYLIVHKVQTNMKMTIKI